MKKSPYLKYKDDFIKLYKEGYSIRGIAKKYNIPNHSVVSNLIKTEVDIRPKSNINNEETLKEAMKLYGEGESLSEICKLLNVGRATLKNRLAKYFDIEATYRYEHLVEDIKLDYKNGLSSKDISKKYNISTQTICNYLHLQQHKVRSYDEASRVYSLDEDYFNINLLNKERVSDLAKIEKSIRFYNHNKVNITGSLDKYDDFYSKIIHKFSSTNKDYQLRDGKYFVYEIVSKNFYNNLKETIENIQNTDFFDYFIEEFIRHNLSVTENYIRMSAKNINIDLFIEHFKSIGLCVIRKPNKTTLCIGSLNEIYKLTEKHPFILDILKSNSERDLSKRFMIKYNK